MNPSPGIFRYRCPSCGTAGQSPHAEEVKCCPRCGEPLSTERWRTATRLGPDRSIPIREGRPELDLKGLRLARLCVLLLHPIVCLWVSLRQRRLETLVNLKLDGLADCRRRDELEQLLGRPVYAVDGARCGAVLRDGNRESPDVIECYESDGCCIDLWFKDDRLVEVSGFVKPTVWDVVLAGGLRQS